MASPSASEAPELPPLSPDTDHFQRLGLPRRWGLEREELERRYLDLAAKVHPDHFAGADERTKLVAREHSAALNEGRRVLMNPVARAEYLVALGGIDLNSTDATTGAPMPSQSFLLEMIERREALADAGRDWDALEALRGEAEGEAQAALERAVKALDAEAFGPAATELVARRYYARWLEEIESAQEDAT